MIILSSTLTIIFSFVITFVFLAGGLILAKEIK
jgi:hypothetical protein